MINGAKTPKLAIQTSALPMYSNLLFKAGVKPVLKICISGFERNALHDLTVSVVGKCGQKEFLHRQDFVKRSFCAEMYNYKQNNSCVFEIAFDNESIDTLFMSSLSEAQEADIYVMATFGKELVTQRKTIKLLPDGLWQGLDFYPETLGLFVNAHEGIHEVCSGVSHISYADCLDDPSRLPKTVKRVYEVLKQKNIIYTRPTGYSASACQTLKKPSELFSATSALATPLELALAFCACAQGCGFDTSLLFVSSKTGENNVLCGLWTKNSPCENIVCEDMSFICSCIKAGELVVTEPGVFAAAQNTSFSLACESAAQAVLACPSEIVCLVDMARINDVFCSEYKAKDVKTGLFDIYSELSNNPEIKFLAGNDSVRFSEVPLLLCDFDSLFKTIGEKHRLYPLDVNVNISDFAGVDHDFCSVVTVDEKKPDKKSISQTTREKKLEAFKKRIANAGGITTAVREERMYDVLAKMAFSKSSAKSYVILGYVRITDKLTQKVKFVPMSAVPVNVIPQGGVYYLSNVSHPIVNKVFVKNSLQKAGIAFEGFMKSAMPLDKEGIISLFTEVCAKLSETDDRYSYGITKEAHIVYMDLSQYFLWNDLSAFKNRITQSKAAKYVFEGNADDKKNESQQSFPVSTLVSDSESMRAVANEKNRIIEGKFTDKKLKVVSATAKKAVTQGKTVLITAPDSITANYTAQFLRNDGFGDGILLFDASTDAHSLSDSLISAIDKCSDTAQTALAQIPDDLYNAANELAVYENAYNKKHRIGTSLNKVLMSYLDASAPQDIPELSVEQSVFANAKENILEELFVKAQRLIAEARRLCKASGLPEYTPINTHPLYNTKPEMEFSQKDEQRVRTLCTNITSVISEYRDTFLDASEITGLEFGHLKTLDSLCALNELYRLALSARDVDVPEVFRKSDIENFSSTVRTVSAIKQRCEAIKFRLPFFDAELFEDIENVLSGNRYEEDEKGFLKKFLHRKNDEDKLIQYVRAENIPALRQKPLEETYVLLYEYKELVKKLSTYNTNDFGFSKELAELAIKAGQLLDRITLDNRNIMLARFFKLVSVIPTDPVLARKITVARAHLAEIFSEGEFSLKELETLLGADFEKMLFENGILSFDGISSFISGAVSSLDVTQNWLTMLEAFEDVQNTLASFAQYIKTHGADSNVDRLFARSLLLPAIKCIKNEFLSGDTLSKTAIAKEKYVSLLYKTADICQRNFEASYSQSVLHQSKTARRESLEVKSNLSAKEYYARHRSIVSKVKPCIVISADMLSELLSEEGTFDLSIVLDRRDSTYRGLPALCFGKSFVAVNMSASEKSSLLYRLEMGGTPVYNTDKIADGVNQKLFSYINSKVLAGKSAGVKYDLQSDAEVVRVNGSYDRMLRINKAQAEHAIIKACELLSQYKDRVAVCCFTNEMSSYCHKNAFALSKSNRFLQQALEYNMIEFCTPDTLCVSGCKTAVVCACVNPDKIYNRAYDYGKAHTNAKTPLGEAYSTVCASAFKKVCFITGVNNADERYNRCVNASYLEMCDFADFLEGTRIPAVLSDAKDKTFTPALLAACGKELGFAEGNGREISGASLVSREQQDKLCIFADLDDGQSMHDELVAKHFASEICQTMTLPVCAVSDIGLKQLSKDLGNRLNG